MTRIRYPKKGYKIGSLRVAFSSKRIGKLFREVWQAIPEEDRQTIIGLGKLELVTDRDDLAPWGRRWCSCMGRAARTKPRGVVNPSLQKSTLLVLGWTWIIGPTRNIKGTIAHELGHAWGNGFYGPDQYHELGTEAVAEQNRNRWGISRS